MLDFDFLRRFWWVAAKSSDLTCDKPLAVKILAEELVLFRNQSGEVGAFPDRCPHRLVPLSQGWVKAGHLVCPYHGWEFSSKGHCTKIPGRLGDCPKVQMLRPLLTHEEHGLIWVCLGDAPDEHQRYLPSHLLARDMTSVVNVFDVPTNMTDMVENFLDPFHTPIVHNRIIRRDDQRHINHVSPRHTQDGFEVVYTKTVEQSYAFRIFNRQINRDLGRFRMPGIVDLEYYSNESFEYANTFYFTPIDQDHVKMISVISLRRRLVPPRLIFALVKPLLKKSLSQDVWILTLQNEANRKYPKIRPVIMDTDIVRRQLELCLSGSSEQLAFKEFDALL